MSNLQTVEEWTERFWARVGRRGPDECWNWIGPLKEFGHGQARWPKALEAIRRPGSIAASRVAWFLTHGWPGDLVVCHKCDNPACCNPSHLFVGTQGDNVQDMIAKGRRRHRPTWAVRQATVLALREKRLQMGLAS